MVSSSLTQSIASWSRKTQKLELLAKKKKTNKTRQKQLSVYIAKCKVSAAFAFLILWASNVLCIPHSSSLTVVNNKGIRRILPALGVWGPLHHLGQWECCPCLEQLWQVFELAAEQDLHWKQEGEDEQKQLCLQKSVAKVEQEKPNLKKNVKVSSLSLT